MFDNVAPSRATVPLVEVKLAGGFTLSARLLSVLISTCAVYGCSYVLAMNHHVRYSICQSCMIIMMIMFHVGGGAVHATYFRWRSGGRGGPTAAAAR